jgi:hypothetical protein
MALGILSLFTGGGNVLKRQSHVTNSQTCPLSLPGQPLAALHHPCGPVPLGVTRILLLIAHLNPLLDFALFALSNGRFIEPDRCVRQRRVCDLCRMHPP